MSKYFKKFFNHQKALWNDEAVNPKPIAWMACLLFIPSIKLSYDLGINMAISIIGIVGMPYIVRAILATFCFPLFTISVPIIIANNAK